MRHTTLLFIVQWLTDTELHVAYSVLSWRLWYTQRPCTLHAAGCGFYSFGLQRNAVFFLLLMIIVVLSWLMYVAYNSFLTSGIRLIQALDILKLKLNGTYMYVGLAVSSSYCKLTPASRSTTPLQHTCTCTGACKSPLSPHVMHIFGAFIRNEKSKSDDI